MGRNRIEFPFNPNGSITFGNTVNFNSIVNFNSVSNFNQAPTFFAGFSFQGAGQVADFLNGTIIKLEPGSSLQVFAGATTTFNNVPTFNAGISFGAGTSTLKNYQENIPFVPTGTGSFTIINGTGGVTFAGILTVIGKFYHYEIVATLTGTATLAATGGGVSVFAGIPFPTLPTAPVIANHATDANSVNYGHGTTFASGSHGSPTIAATHGGGSICWSCEGLLT